MSSLHGGEDRPIGSGGTVPVPGYTFVEAGWLFDYRHWYPQNSQNVPVGSVQVYVLVYERVYEPTYEHA